MTRRSSLVRYSAPAGALASVATLTLLGCAGSPTHVNDLRVAGRLPGVKPEGVEFVRTKDFRRGPAPYGYIRIVGSADPQWDPIQANQSNPADSLTWTFLGPKPMSSEYWSGEGNAGGRTVSIAPHPTDPNTCYIATASGGIWKTIDGGTNWTPLTDTLATMNHGALAIVTQAPSTLYAGTGEYGSGSDGDGIFKSSDAGVTWSKVCDDSQIGNQVSSIVVDPLNASNIHATGSNGYWRSTNAGASWTQLQTGSCASVVLDAVNPQNVYVGRNAQGIYKSTNGGTSFTKLAGGLPTSGFSSVYLTICNATPNVLYAVLLGSGGLQGLYRSADSGATWTKKAATPNFPQYGDYACFVSVDPANANRVFAGGVDPSFSNAGVIRTLNGGDTWTDVSEYAGGRLHPDHHAVAFGPGSVIWTSNDGGIYKSTSGGTTWINLNSTLAAAQIYNLVHHPAQPEKALGGTQDNGTPERTGVTFTWPQLQIGDGGFSVYDPSVTVNRRYTTYVYLDITRWVNNSPVGITGNWGADATNFIAPLVGDANSPSTLVGGTNRVWRTTNASTGAPTWTAISTSANAGGGTLNMVAVAPSNSLTIYSGASTGKVFVTKNAATWTDRSAGLPVGQVSDIIIDPKNPDVAYVSFYNSSGNRILKTANAGANWTNVTGTLPAGVPVTCIEVDFATSPRTIYAGSGAGLYTSIDEGATWVKNDNSFPNVNINDFFIDHANRTLSAGTYGRGAWRTPLPPPSSCLADCDSSNSLTIDDFICFQTLFAIGDPKADCDASGNLDIDDFICFQTLFALGC